MRMLIAVVLMLAACGGEVAEPEAPSAPTAAPASQAAAAQPAAAQASGAFVVRRADGAELVTVQEHGNGTVDITFLAADGAKRTLRGEPRETGKRKYRIGDGPVMFEIKPGDDRDFKLRMADGKLRWKVKVSNEKTKISDNEQNANPFELKPRDGNRVKVTAPGDRELGNVRLEGSTNTVEDASGKKLFTAAGSKPSAAMGVLLLDSVQDLERYILLAELRYREQ